MTEIEKKRHGGPPRKEREEKRERQRKQRRKTVPGAAGRVGAAWVRGVGVGGDGARLARRLNYQSPNSCAHVAVTGPRPVATSCPQSQPMREG